ncbi:NAD(P)-dependent oxidoreductase [Bosea sp. (in: a-proteobacteria)]|uniref:NAD(P)-dependent oxidoreductase n=1 Tax=Bosea sp. (in: a-proteobacteria) TaxID=1871050 RepID=UPI002617415F|nr:NAD(P)-dependent oxidoreductase [Bosea sp. (in: a-proteobacteria)]MCO5091009.1 NAD(P)-dependent oxidoreductase [Bosea sp. (in: a-proteobacteria)]
MAEGGNRPAIGFIGLGRMGVPMAARLVAAGFTVFGYDRVATAIERFAAAGGSPAASAAEAAAADVVILMLPSSAVVNAVLADKAFALALRPGAVLIDMGSSEPLQSRRIHDELAGRGARFLDAPVSGGVRGAQKGALTVMVGASEADFAAMQPLLTHFGRVVHAGPVGAGHAVKALNNLLSATHLLATSEAMRASARFGLKPEVVLGIFNTSSGKSGSTETKWPNFVLTESYDSGFALELMLKDMEVAVDLASRLGVEAPLATRSVALWRAAKAALRDGADHTEIALWNEEMPEDVAG